MKQFALYRFCLLGTACDSFFYDEKANQKCKLYQHVSLKDRNIWEVVEKTSTTGAVYFLQCSTPQENILPNNELYTQDKAGKELSDKWWVFRYTFDTFSDDGHSDWSVLSTCDGPVDNAWGVIEHWKFRQSAQSNTNGFYEKSIGAHCQQGIKYK